MNDEESMKNNEQEMEMNGAQDPMEVDHELRVRKSTKRKLPVGDDEEDDNDDTITTPKIPEVLEPTTMSPAGKVILSEVTYQPRRMNQALVSVNVSFILFESNRSLTRFADRMICGAS